MKKHLLCKKHYLTLAVICIIALITGLVACAPTPSGNDGGGAQDIVMPTPDEYGVVHAVQWAEIYPAECASYLENMSNSRGGLKHDYLKMYPALATLYAGVAFAKGYDQAASHLYSLESVRETPRVNENTLLNCYTCKTPQFTALVNSEGVGVYSQPFANGTSFTEPISCYTCHANDPETTTVTAGYWVTALGSDITKVPEGAAVCGQCHITYYFDPVTKATMSPTNGLLSMSAETILAYQDSLNIKDWVYPVTETPMIKVRHPEFETVYGGNNPSAMAHYSCGNCHMGVATAADGTEYTSHFWQSPLENKELLANCNSRHIDLAKTVKIKQDTYAKRVQEISLRLETMVKLFVAKVQANALNTEQLAQMQQIHRQAQFYWDFTMVENSNGAHNAAVSNANLDRCEALIAQGMKLLESL